MRVRIVQFAGSSLALLALVCAAAGCSQSAGMSEANRAYKAGRFDEATASAGRAASQSSGQDRYEAAYLAGISAYRAGDFATAESHLMAATYSTNNEIAGRANATLGLLRLTEGRPALAAPYFKAASTQLKGEEAAIAARRAADCYEQSGRPDEAAALRRIAGPGISPASTTATASPASRPTSVAATGVAVGSFTIQLGAFSNRANAETSAASIRSQAAAQGLGVPRIITVVRDGRALHIVQVGTFTSRVEAEAARSRLGQRDAIIASAATR